MRSFENLNLRPRTQDTWHIIKISTYSSNIWECKFIILSIINIRCSIRLSVVRKKDEKKTQSNTHTHRQTDRTKTRGVHLRQSIKNQDVVGSRGTSIFFLRLYEIPVFHGGAARIRFSLVWRPRRGGGGQADITPRSHSGFAFIIFTLSLRIIFSSVVALFSLRSRLPLFKFPSQFGIVFGFLFNIFFFSFFHANIFLSLYTFFFFSGGRLSPLCTWLVDTKASFCKGYVMGFRILARVSLPFFLLHLSV